MPNKGYFDIKRDIEVINAGGFFCQACLVGKPVAEQSSDPRYCQGCYAFLVKETEMLDGRKPTWAPKDSQSITRTPSELPCKPYKRGHNYIDTQIGQIIGSGIMSTVESKKDNGKRGPKHKALPLELIKQWSSKGMGSKAITSRLNNELGITVSYKTIQRIISGERKQQTL